MKSNQIKSNINLKDLTDAAFILQEFLQKEYWRFKWNYLSAKELVDNKMPGDQHLKKQLGNANQKL